MGGEQCCGGEGEKPCTPVVQLQRASRAACLLQAHPTGEEATQASITGGSCALCPYWILNSVGFLRVGGFFSLPGQEAEAQTYRSPSES